ncbi:MAG: class I SAM-dependent methyltransferase [Planctomycetes bacterium]|nr:class I SAM-dependent methyltransferase [Planctomycetota bacterium]
MTGPRVLRDLAALRGGALAAANEFPHLRVRTDLGALVRDELAEVPESRGVDRSRVDPGLLEGLYDLRARLLDWELGTGYLGYFSENPGTRYTFTRRLEVLWGLLGRAEMAGDRALEVGCGAGVVSLLLARGGFRVEGVDVAGPAVRYARRAAALAGLAGVRFREARAETLPYPDGRFDLVLATEVLEHLEDPRRALREWRRVLAPGGTLLVSCPCASTPSEAFADLARRVLRDLETERPDGFDKKTFLRARRAGLTVEDRAFLLPHARFGHAALTRLFRREGLDVEAGRGAVLAFPPHYGLVYRALPGAALGAVRALEEALERLGVFARWGSVTTCFRLRPRGAAA